MPSTTASWSDPPAPRRRRALVYRARGGEPLPPRRGTIRNLLSTYELPRRLVRGPGRNPRRIALRSPSTILCSVSPSAPDSAECRSTAQQSQQRDAHGVRAVHHEGADAPILTSTLRTGHDHCPCRVPEWGSQIPSFAGRQSWASLRLVTTM